MELSVALIVKNEEKVLARCLESIKDLVSEIIIVDTGSTDTTKDIALKYTNKIYDFKWINDFSAARNFSFDKCTKDWIIWLDADDVIKENDKEKIRKLDFSDKEIILCKYEYAHDEYDNSTLSFKRERIIKRSLNLRWEQPIHEYLPLNGKIYQTDIEIHHYKQANNSERNLNILQDIIKKNPNDSRLQYYLGKELYDFGKFDDAKKWLKKFVNNPLSWWEDKYSAYLKLAEISFKDDELKFKKYVFECINLEERKAEAYFLLGRFYESKNSYVKAIQWYKHCLNVDFPSDLNSSLLIEQYTWAPALQLCVCYNYVGDIEKANYYNDLVLKYRPNDSRALHNKNIFLNAFNKKIDGNNKKLNLGCGKKTKEGFENVDNFKADYIDKTYNLYDIPYINNSISEIHSEHSLEHVGYEKGNLAINEWFRVLKPGGILDLKIPDLELCITKFLESTEENYKQWYKFTIFGYQKALAGESDDSQIHRWGYTKNDIRKNLESVGFIIDYLVNYDGYDTPSIAIRAIKPISNIKVGWISPINWDAAQTRIRVLNINRWLRSKGYISNIVNYPDIIRENYDITIVGKTFDENHFLNIKLLKQNNKIVYCDLCEDILDFPWVKEILQLCDKVICCSTRLAEKVNNINKNTIIIEDSIET